MALWQCVLWKYDTIILTVALISGLLSLPGCSSDAARFDTEEYAASAAEREIVATLYSSGTEPVPATAPADALATSSVELTLSAVLAVAFEKNPTFAEFEANRAIARAEVREARAWRNPELETSLSFVDNTESSEEYEIGIAQPVELPMKRRARVKAAEALEGLIEFEQAAFHALLRAEVSKAYWSVVFLSRSADLAGKNHELDQRILDTVKSRVEAGGAPPIDLIKARVEWLAAQRMLRKAQRELRTAFKQLNALCGQALPAEFRGGDEFETDFHAVNPAEAHDLAIQYNPEWLSLKAQHRQKQLQLERELAARYPDLVPGIGFEHEDEADSTFVSLGVEIPLWNRNRGAIERTEAELQLLAARIEKQRQDVLRNTGAAIEEYSGALEQLELFGELRSAADEALRTETFLYEQGEADYLELTDARRTAQASQAEYLAAIYQAHLSQIELEKIIGIKGLE